MLLGFAQQNKPEDIERILEASKMELRWGALDPSEGNSVGQTALHVACLWGNFEAAECLVRNKVGRAKHVCTMLLQRFGSAESRAVHDGF
jgi:hypothetical protein